jgi:hypothetical protein
VGGASCGRRTPAEQSRTGDDCQERAPRDAVRARCPPGTRAVLSYLAANLLASYARYCIASASVSAALATLT